MCAVLIGLSGGAGSAAALRMLTETEERVIAAAVDCPLCNVASARTIADEAGVEFIRIDGQAAFEREVVRPWANAIARGTEPCAQALFTAHVLFPLLEREANTRACTHIATGHRALLRPVETMADSSEDTANAQRLSAPKLDKQCRVIDSGQNEPDTISNIGIFADPDCDISLDQSWLLGSLQASTTERLVLPWEHVDRTAFADLADSSSPAHGFPPADQNTLLHDLGLPDYEGDIVDKAGNVLNHYKSITAYRLGQTMPLADKAGETWILVRKDPARRRLVVAPCEQAATRECLVNDLHWLVNPPTGPLQVQARIAPALHPHAQAVSALVETMGGMAMLCGSVGAVTRFVPDEPSTLIASGQPVAFYDRDQRLLGSGTLA